MKISVIIPCYNEAATVEEIIRRVSDSNAPYERQVIVVDDGSTDGSGTLLEELVQHFPIHVVRHAANLGKGAAFRSALKIADGDIVLIQDADLEYTPGDHDRLLAPLKSGEADIVYGTRFNGKGKRGYWPHYLFNRFSSAVVRAFTSLPATDVLTGHKAFRTDLLQGAKLQAAGFDMDIELTLKIAATRPARFREVPIDYRPRGYRHGKKILPWHAVAILAYILRTALFGIVTRQANTQNIPSKSTTARANASSR